MWSPNELLKIEKQRDILSYITLQFFHFKKVPLEHCPFRAGKIFFYYRVVGDLDGFSSRFFPAARLGSTFPVSRKQAILSVSSILQPETGRAFSLQNSTSSCFR